MASGPFRQLDTVVRNQIVETVDDFGLIPRGSGSRIALAEERLHPRGPRRFDFFHRIGNEQKLVRLMR